jgi:hypothetical protein
MKIDVDDARSVVAEVIDAAGLADFLKMEHGGAAPG